MTRTIKPTSIGGWALTAIGTVLLLLAVFGLFLPDVGLSACVAVGLVAAMFIVKGLDARSEEPRDALESKRPHLRVSMHFLVWTVALSLPIIVYFVGTGLGVVRDPNGGLLTTVAIAQGGVYIVAGVLSAIFRPKAESRGEYLLGIPDFIQGALILVGIAVAVVGWLMSLGK